MDIVEVNRKGHPCNPVRVERSEMIEGDEIVGEKKEAPKAKKKTSKKLK
jgi:hypothetical protein